MYILLEFVGCVIVVSGARAALLAASVMYIIAPCTGVLDL